MSSRDDPSRPPLALIVGCAGPRLGDDEARFLAEARPLGFILFARNCEHPGQVRTLVAELRSAVGSADAPVLIDQEGGRVARLRPPHWYAGRPARAFADLHKRDPGAGVEAIWLHARLIADDLASLGIDVDCAPVVDVPAPDGHDVIGDRASGTEPPPVIALARAFAEGLAAGGVAPMIKHMPGHGRARVDSHVALPVVQATLASLRAFDFPPFRALRDIPWAMTAHVVYSAIDHALPATASPRVIGEVIRGEIGYDGLLLSDDISMGALSGTLAERTRAILAAGCDVVLHCSGDLAEAQAIADAARPLDAAALRRLARARAWRSAPSPFDRSAALARLETLLAPLVA